MDTKTYFRGYIDADTQTVWNYDFECYVCKGEGELCRGCSGMSMKYPHLFGGCDLNVKCPNCTKFEPPHNIDVNDFEEIEVLSWFRSQKLIEASKFKIKFRPDRYLLEDGTVKFAYHINKFPNF